MYASLALQYRMKMRMKLFDIPIRWSNDSYNINTETKDFESVCSIICKKNTHGDTSLVQMTMILSIINKSADIAKNTWNGFFFKEKKGIYCNEIPSWLHSLWRTLNIVNEYTGMHRTLRVYSNEYDSMWVLREFVSEYGSECGSEYASSVEGVWQ